MASMRYCPKCNRDTDVSIWTTERIIILIVLLFLGIILGVIYLIYVVTREEKCAVCGTPATMLGPPRYGQQNFTAASDKMFCPQCGKENNSSSKYCAFCGTTIGMK